MSKKSGFLDAYAAGREAFEGRSRYAFVGGAFGVIVGRIVERRYSLPWFEGFPISVLIIVGLALLFPFVEGRIKRAIVEKHDHS